MKKNSFSLVEIILAMAIFVIFASGSMAVVLQAMDMNRLGGEQTIANQYAGEGLEAVRSIRNRAYTNLINTLSTGITVSGNLWIFGGTQNTYDKYTRTISIADVYRDGQGNVVTSEGTLDPDTKKITSTVNWNVAANRNNSVILSTYLTNWKNIIPTPIASCSSTCISLGGYTYGICRQTKNLCISNGEIYENTGDPYCVNNPLEKMCCCGTGSTPTPLPTSTPIPTTAPSATPIPMNCNQFCVQKWNLPGNCIKRNNCTGHNEGRIYECIAPNICCCQ